jgi:TadE-like protein
MVELLLAGTVLLFLILAVIQLSLLWAGKGAVDTAAHLAARRFARSAREDFRKAREVAFLEAFRVCRERPGGSLGSVGLTALDITRDGERGSGTASAGDPMCVRLTHGVELVVPWVDRILFALFPGKKLMLGDRRYLMLQASRWVTVE